MKCRDECVWWLLRGASLYGAAGDPGMKCNLMLQSILPWAGKEDPSEAMTGGKDKESCSRSSSRKGRDHPGGGNQVSDLKANVILRADSTRKTERHSAWVREGHNPFSR